MNIPIIETQRLILREFRDSSDFDIYANFYASDLTKYYGDPLDRSAAWRAAAAMRQIEHETRGSILIYRHCA